MLFSRWFNLFMNRLRRLLVLSFTYVKIQFNHCILKSFDFYINGFFNIVLFLYIKIALIQQQNQIIYNKFRIKYFIFSYLTFNTIK